MISSIQRHYLKKNKKIKFFWGDGSDEIFRKSLKATIDAFRVIRSLNKAKLAMVGNVAAGFYDLNINQEAITEKLGTIIEKIDIDTVINRAGSLSNNDVQKRIIQLKQQIDFNGFDMEMVNRSVRLELTLKQMCNEQEIDILAIDCWPKFQLDYNVMACSMIGNLNDSGIVASCEGDIESALSMYALSSLACRPSILMDMSTLSTKEDAICLWHCGQGSVSYADKKRVKLGCTLCKDAYSPGCPSTDLGPGNFMKLAEGFYTIMRFTSNAQEMLIATGNISKFDLPYWDGNIGWMTDLELNGEKVSALDFANTVIASGFQHHFPLVMNNYLAELKEIGAWLGLTQIKATRYRHFLE